MRIFGHKMWDGGFAAETCRQPAVRAAQPAVIRWCSGVLRSLGRSNSVVFKRQRRVDGGLTAGFGDNLPSGKSSE